MLSSSIGKVIKADTVWVIKGTEENTLLATLRNRIMIFWYEAHTHSERVILCCRFWWFSASLKMYINLFWRGPGALLCFVSPAHLDSVYDSPRKNVFLLIFIVCYLERPRFAGCSGSFWDFNTSRNERGQAVFITTGRKTGTTGGFNQLRSD